MSNHSLWWKFWLPFAYNDSPNRLEGSNPNALVWLYFICYIMYLELIIEGTHLVQLVYLNSKET